MREEVLHELAQLVAQCADRRKLQDDNPDYFRAEVASRELLLAWLLPNDDGFPVSAEIVRRVSLLKNLLQGSAEDYAPLVTVASRYVDLPTAVAQALLDSTMLVLLAALRDGASVLVVTFEPDGLEFTPTVRIESDSPGVAALPETHTDRLAISALRDIGGDWGANQTAHETWEVVLRVPA